MRKGVNGFNRRARSRARSRSRLRGRVGILVLLFLAACKSATGEGDVDRLAGTWRWISSSGGFAGSTITPATAGFNVQFRFSGNQVTVLRNDSVRGTSTYTIRGDEITYQPAISVFNFDGSVDTQSIVPLAGDTVLFSDPCCDRYSHRFVRVK